MPIITPLPIEIAFPAIPVELPPPPMWRIKSPRTWVHAPIPVEIEFPLNRPTTVELPLKINVPGVGTFEVHLNLNVVERAQA